MTTKRIQPERLFQRSLKGHTLYSHVVIASGQSLVFIAGQLARDGEGRIVGKGDMGAQIRQVGENLRIALEAAGLGLKDLVKTTTYVADIDEFFKHPEVRERDFRPGASDQHDGRGATAVASGLDGRSGGYGRDRSMMRQRPYLYRGGCSGPGSARSAAIASCFSCRAASHPPTARSTTTSSAKPMPTGPATFVNSSPIR